MTSFESESLLTDSFTDRHLGPSAHDVKTMLKVLGQSDLESFVSNVIPPTIRLKKELDLPKAASEHQALEELKRMASENKVYRSLIGVGYYGTIVPGVIQRNILENPGWYTQYTPYQAEIAQGRLEALLNFQTMVMDLTAMEIANASLLDEGTAAAEAMAMAFALHETQEVSHRFFVADDCHPQTIAVLRTRSEAVGIELEIGDPRKIDWERKYVGALLQYPGTDGRIHDYSEFVEKAHASGAYVAVAVDLLSLCLVTPPGEWGADIVIGSSQRFGVPMGFGGPHAAFLATKSEFSRKLPGRLVAVSRDRSGRPAIRLALQTREQHIRRDKATSNICTAQVLLAIMASMYAVYHGPEGLKRIARRVHRNACLIKAALKKLGHKVTEGPFFDTIHLELVGMTGGEALSRALAAGFNLRPLPQNRLTLSVDERTNDSEIQSLVSALSTGNMLKWSEIEATATKEIQGKFERKSEFLKHPVFHEHRSETSMLRYIRGLEAKDLSLTSSMIPLGSCTMKLNASSELYPITWPEFAELHPFAPVEQTKGYLTLFTQLEKWLGEITGFDGISLQPNAGSQGEYAGLLVIREYHRSRGDKGRNVCLIPKSAHGTNPASAVMAGMRVVVVNCDDHGNVDVADLEKKAKEHSKELSALMVTYPSTHGVFETEIKKICDIVHSNGGQVYMDGANMNAQVGFCRPGDFGPDVCHLNLHKTFCIPHGGGGPGMGPIGVKAHLKAFLPGHPVVKTGGDKPIGPVSAAPWGSPSILPISWMYIRMMGGDGLRKATAVAMLSANYLAKKLDPLFPVLYRGANGLVAHEAIFDMRPLKKRSDVEVEDVAKRLMDYGFHAPTVSFPVPGTIMVEPTESEPIQELDRFLTAMKAIFDEAEAISGGRYPKNDNPLKNAPHTAADVTVDEWKHPYSRETAVFPVAELKARKFWPPVSRIDNVWGDRHLFCACVPVEGFDSETTG